MITLNKKKFDERYFSRLTFSKKGISVQNFIKQKTYYLIIIR